MQILDAWKRLALLVLLLGVVPSVAGANTTPVKTEIGGEELAFDTEDGVALKGNLFAPKGKAKGGIVFVHEPNRSSRDFAYLAEKMSRHGFAALVFDLRGHGRSLMRGDEELDREIFMDEDYAAMALDLSAAVAELRGAIGDDAPVHLAGSDLGGSLSLLHALDDDGVRSVAMLSPGLGYDGVNVLGKTKHFGNRPLLLVLSVEDGYARKSAEVMEKEATGPLHIETYYGVGHGSKMLAREPKLEVLMTSWFLGTVITAEGRGLEDAGKPIAEGKDLQGTALDNDAERRRLEAERKKAEDAKIGTGVGDDEERPKKRYSADGDR